jgi:UDPglucose--hexose-1-phosphate uridylyltransferase
VSETRFNELRGEPVVYAIHRQERTFLPDRDHCPLDPTRAGAPPTEIPLAAFEIVVFDNRFPAFEAPSGAAEVVVYTDDHDSSLGALPLARIEELMWVWRHRYQELGAREDVEYVYIFENRGIEVGVTLHHPHGQIYGYPFLPPVAALELAADERLGGCAGCAAVHDERDSARRLIFENQATAVYVPRAARWPYEAHISMREHRPSLLECDPEELAMLAASLRALLRGYDALFDRPLPYVMAVHQAPTGAGGSESQGHLHIEFYPPLRTAEKMKFLAGSEQGAGTFISDVLPEDAALRLRAAIDRAG